MNKETLLNQLSQGPVEVTFTKKNGEIRKMKCTRSSTLIPSEFTPKGEAINIQNDDNIRVFDLDKQSWRSFNFSSVV